jgi:hypothetical protein
MNVAWHGRRSGASSGLGLCQAESVVGAESSDLQGLNGEVEVVRGDGRRGDGARPKRGHADALGHICFDELESRVVEEMLQVARSAREEVVDADDVGSLNSHFMAVPRPWAGRRSHT